MSGMPVTLSQESYDATLEDIKKLRERNKDLEHENKALRLQATTYFDKWAESMGKANAFDEIREERNWASDAEEYVINVEHIIEELERGE